MAARITRCRSAGGRPLAFLGLAESAAFVVVRQQISSSTNKGCSPVLGGVMLRMAGGREESFESPWRKRRRKIMMQPLRLHSTGAAFSGTTTSHSSSPPPAVVGSQCFRYGTTSSYTTVQRHPPVGAGSLRLGRWWTPRWFSSSSHPAATAIKKKKKKQNDRRPRVPETTTTSADTPLRRSRRRQNNNNNNNSNHHPEFSHDDDESASDFDKNIEHEDHARTTSSSSSKSGRNDAVFRPKNVNDDDEDEDEDDAPRRLATLWTAPSRPAAQHPAVLTILSGTVTTTTVNQQQQQQPDSTTTATILPPPPGEIGTWRNNHSTIATKKKKDTNTISREQIQEAKVGTTSTESPSPSAESTPSSDPKQSTATTTTQNGTDRRSSTNSSNKSKRWKEAKRAMHLRESQEVVNPNSNGNRPKLIANDDSHPKPRISTNQQQNQQQPRLWWQTAATTPPAILENAVMDLSSSHNRNGTEIDTVTSSNLPVKINSIIISSSGDPPMKPAAHETVPEDPSDVKASSSISNEKEVPSTASAANIAPIMDRSSNSSSEEGLWKAPLFPMEQRVDESTTPTGKDLLFRPLEAPSTRMETKPRNGAVVGTMRGSKDSNPTQGNNDVPLTEENDSQPLSQTTKKSVSGTAWWKQVQSPF